MSPFRRPASRESSEQQDQARSRALLEHGEVVALVLDRSGRLVEASRRALELFPTLELGSELPGALELTNMRRVRYGKDGETLIVAPLDEQRAFQELRVGFTASVSHELRTPLARLLVLLESIELHPGEATALAAEARGEVEQMRELIDDVLFLSELETGREVVALGRTQAMPLLRELCRELEERAERAGIRLRVEGDETIELPLRPRMLRTVVGNLLTNAIRYAGEGTTCVVSLGASVDGGFELVVADDGGGVSDRDLPRLFERFYRGDRARTSHGTGLGLAIVKHVVVAGGGSISAEGGPGRGLQVRCRFPA
ncbi:MAG: sensor histidine kinase [Gaiellaceae bacterium]